MAVYEVLIISGGVLSAGLAVFHCFFYTYFKWEDDLSTVSLLNRRIFITLYIALIAVFLFYAVLSLYYSEELSRCNGLAGCITGFYAFVWLFRVIWQLTYLKPLKYEKPIIHYILIVWFVLLLAAYALPVAVSLFKTQSFRSLFLNSIFYHFGG